MKRAAGRRLFTCMLFCAVVSSAALVGWLPARSGEPAQGDQPAREITNSIGVKLRLIPAGDFLMGADETQAQLEKDFGEFRKNVQVADEHPQHEARISKPYYLGVYEVSLSEFRQFVNDAA